jgi:peptidoglycan hydrolase CwlO-like protein
MDREEELSKIKAQIENNKKLVDERRAEIAQLEAELARNKELLAKVEQIRALLDK